MAGSWLAEAYPDLRLLSAQMQSKMQDKVATLADKIKDNIRRLKEELDKLEDCSGDIPAASNQVPKMRQCSVDSWFPWLITIACISGKFGIEIYICLNSLWMVPNFKLCSNLGTFPTYFEFSLVFLQF